MIYNSSRSDFDEAFAYRVVALWESSPDRPGSFELESNDELVIALPDFHSSNSVVTLLKN